MTKRTYFTFSNNVSKLVGTFAGFNLAKIMTVLFLPPQMNQNATSSAIGSHCVYYFKKKMTVAMLLLWLSS